MFETINTILNNLAKNEPLALALAIGLFIWIIIKMK